MSSDPDSSSPQQSVQVAGGEEEESSEEEEGGDRACQTLEPVRALPRRRAKVSLASGLR